MANLAGLLLGIWLFGRAVTETCPAVLCGHERTESCGGYPIRPSELLIQQCLQQDFTCQMPDFREQRDLLCLPFNGNQYDLWNPYRSVVGDEYADFDWRNEDEVCDSERNLCGKATYCSEEGKCRERKAAKETCFPGECESGLICSLQVCIPVGSLPVGSVTDSQWACKGFTLDKDLQMCVNPTKSKGKLPIKCQSDADCVSTDGSFSECVCGLNPQGQRYCNLHRGDDIMQTYLQAEAERDIKRLRWAYFQASFYPLFQENPNCVDEVFPVPFLYQRYKQAQSSTIALAALYLTLALV